MADIGYIQDEDLEETDEVQEDEGPTVQSQHEDWVLLSPVLRLQKYATCENVFIRQMVGRVLLEVLRGPLDTYFDDLPQLTEIVARVADDHETSVRTELVEQIPHIAIICRETRSQELNDLVNVHLLTVIIKYLSDSDNLVRKTAQAALLVLMDQGLVDRAAIEDRVCPAIIELSRIDSVMDFHTGAVALMSKMAPLLGTEATERLFLDRFAELCSNHVFCVRKVCASNFGEFSAVVGQQASEEILLPRFMQLCQDEVWGVRKACAEVVTTVSFACSPSLRRDELAPLFVKLLEDSSRWVRISAFQTLGPFISTFAEPRITGLAYNQHGDLVLTSAEGTEHRVQCPSVVPYAPELIPLPHFYNKLQPNSETLCYNITVTPLSLSEKYAQDNDKTRFDKDYELDEEEINPLAAKEAVTDLVHKEEENISLPASNKSETNSLASELSSIIKRAIENKQQEEKTINLEPPMAAEVKECLNQFLPQFAKTQEANKSMDLEVLFDASCCVKTKDTSDLAPDKSQDIENLNAGDHSEDKDIKAMMKKSVRNVSKGVRKGRAFNPALCSKLMKLKTDDDWRSDYDWTSEEQESENHIVEEPPLDSLPQYNSYQYWYVKPDTPLDLLPEAKCPDRILQEICEKFALECGYFTDSPSQPVTSGPSMPVQNIVPQALVNHFVSMVEPGVAQETDSESAHYCAFSLPAVALTLGKKNWPLLKRTYEMLASDMQWKVRKTIASSIHELASILGEDLATQDLAPIFDALIKDLDEVRIGALKHMAQFFKSIQHAERSLFLPRLEEFLKTDNRCNWRFRMELAMQLLHSLELFTPAQCSRHITGIAIVLLSDKVAAVRQVSIDLVTTLVRHFSSDAPLASAFLVLLAEQFAHSRHWSRRQTYAILCGRFVQIETLSMRQLEIEVLPHLLDQSWDPVPNVRLATAQTLVEIIAVHEYFADPSCSEYKNIQLTIRRLQSDKDRDVRYFSKSPHTEMDSSSHNNSDDVINSSIVEHVNKIMNYGNGPSVREWNRNEHIDTRDSGDSIQTYNDRLSTQESRISDVVTTFFAQNKITGLTELSPNSNVDSEAQ